jgi:ABC-type glycerol-3-phosphate transport system substrate-binding protein
MKHWGYCLNLLLALVFATFGLGACSPTVTPDPAEIYIIVHAAYSVDEYVAQFEAAHPDIRVHVSYRQDIPEDWPKHFDGALLSHAPVMYPEEANLLLDLMPLMEADAQFDTEDYFPGALATGDLNGRRVAIPIALSFNALVYDPRQLSEAGAPLPTPGWSWEDLANIARAVGRYHADAGGGAVFVDKGEWSLLLANWLHEQAPLFEEAHGRITPRLTQPELQSAVTKARSTVVELTAAVEPGSTTDRPLAYLQAGTAAMSTQTPLLFFARQHQRYPELAVAALPQPNIYEDMQAFGVLAISRGAAHRQAVWQWIRFLSQQNFLSVGIPAWPARSSIAEEQRLWETIDPKVAQVIHAILAAQDGAKMGQNQEPLWSIRSQLVGAVMQVYDLGADPRTALTEAQQQAMAEISTWYDEQDDQFESFSTAPSPGADRIEASETLRVSVWDDRLEKVFLALAKEFEASHPGWFVQVIPLSGMAEVDSASFQMNSFETLSLLSMQEILLPVESLSELDPSLTDDAFFPQAVEAVSWRGQLLGIPTAIRPLLLYYDPGVFVQLDLAPPTSDWTVTDMLNAAEKIAIANPDLLGYAAHSGAEVRFVLAQQGISLFGDEQPYPYPRFIEFDVLQAIERLRVLQGGEPAVTWDISAVMELPISSGQPLRHRSSPMKFVALQPYPGTRWPVQVYVNGVSRQSANVRMAWEWVTFLTTQGDLHGTALPAVRVRAKSQAARHALGSDLHTAYMTALERDAMMPSDRETMIVKDAAKLWFDEAMWSVASEGLESALEHAQINAEQFVDCVSARDAIDIQLLATCAQQIDPQHPLTNIASSQR